MVLTLLTGEQTGNTRPSTPCQNKEALLRVEDPHGVPLHISPQYLLGFNVRCPSIFFNFPREIKIFPLEGKNSLPHISLSAVEWGKEEKQA